MLEVNIILGAAAIVCGIAGLLLLLGPPETRKRKKHGKLVRMKYAGMEDLPETPPEERIIPVTTEEIRLEEKLSASLPVPEDSPLTSGEKEEDDGLGGIPLQPFEL